MNKSPQGLILHDYFAMIGGGEKLVLTLADFLEWPVTAGFVESGLLEQTDFVIALNSLHAYSGLAPLRILSLIQKWQRVRFNRLDNIIYSGVYAPLSVLNNQANNILYCHTPPRFVYDKRDYYLNTLPAWQRYFFKYLINYFRHKYELAIKNMDIVVANSQHIQKRIKTYLNADSQVIYPPCDTQHFQWQSQGDYYLSTARLDGLKRVDVIVQAFMQMPDKKLIVASGGSELDKLKHMAKDSKNIHFSNWISQEKLYDLVNNCIASIYIPYDEDFGISPVESMAAGKPVVGVNEGGLTETIIDQQTGYLLDTAKNLQPQLIETINQLDLKQARNMKEACEIQAKRFSQEIFLEQMGALLL